ncbi:hypothetical protein VHEMI08523 [[Torrubiella] hemipterigena]|uniref:Cyclin-like domain-containing protein n=1 Tax=[Torrubiella] hemipterigena TaxID=1531966 RepID=A0A0A1T6Y2_9HYPO|nr:hypothetical protein VHEMI08523 [[Torrubiella] hemipterigena]
MATEDERYRNSSQFRLWSYSPKALKELREKTNNLAQQQIIPRLAADALPEFLTTDEEIQLVKFFTVELLRAAEFLDLPTEIRATAAIFLRRFYITNSVMTYPPDDLLKTCIFFGCKAENFYYRLNKLADALPNTTSEQILAGEFLLCQGMRFAFDVRHPFRALEGAILELRNRLPDEEKRIQAAHGQARHILKFSSILTDVYFHFTPSQIMLAALLISDPGLANELIPTTGIDSAIREKIISTIEQCKTMLQQEPPENMNQYSTASDTIKVIKRLRKKLRKCRDPDRADLVALQKARREQAMNKPKPSNGGQMLADAAVFGDAESREAKRRKLEAANDMFGPALG